MNIVEFTEGFAVLNYPLTLAEVRQKHPNTSFSEPPTDVGLAPYNKALVRETERPIVEIGDEVIEGEPIRDANGVWWQTWIVNTPDDERVTQLKTEMEAQVFDIVEKKLKAAIPENRGMLTAVVEMIEQPNHPVRQKAANLRPKVTDIIQRIRAATTLGEALAIRDEIEGA
jgi:hypothetical protein